MTWINQQGQLYEGDQQPGDVLATEKEVTTFNTTRLSIQMREKRNQIISDTSYLMESDYPISAIKLAELKIYRQSLRDIPTQDGFPENITWPEFELVTK